MTDMIFKDYRAPEESLLTPFQEDYAGKDRGNQREQFLSDPHPRI